jgi:hypothetical protein
MVISLIFLFILLSVSVYINYNLYKKYDVLEELYSNLEKSATEDQSFIMAMRSRVMSQRSYLKQLDKNGSFESDDEVGYFFKELKKIINDIALYLEMEESEDEKEEVSKKFNGRIK